MVRLSATTFRATIGVQPAPFRRSNRSQRWSIRSTNGLLGPRRRSADGLNHRKASRPLCWNREAVTAPWVRRR